MACFLGQILNARVTYFFLQHREQSIVCWKYPCESRTPSNQCLKATEMWHFLASCAHYIDHLGMQDVHERFVTSRNSSSNDVLRLMFQKFIIVQTTTMTKIQDSSQLLFNYDENKTPVTEQHLFHHRSSSQPSSDAEL